METSLLFLYLIFLLSIILLTIAGVIEAAFVIPLQYKQLKVKNGLAALRRQMIGKGILSLTVIVVAIFCLMGRFIISDVNILRYTITTMIFAFSLGIFGKAVIDYRIYHQQFSEESKKLHELFEEYEIASKLAKVDRAVKK